MRIGSVNTHKDQEACATSLLGIFDEAHAESNVILNPPCTQPAEL